jgi:hypothetical protein
MSAGTKMVLDVTMRRNSAIGLESCDDLDGPSSRGHLRMGNNAPCAQGTISSV